MIESGFAARSHASAMIDVINTDQYATECACLRILNNIFQ